MSLEEGCCAAVWAGYRCEGGGELTRREAFACKVAKPLAGNLPRMVCEAALGHGQEDYPAFRRRWTMNDP